MKSNVQNLKRALLSIVGVGAVAAVAAFSGSADAFVSSGASTGSAKGSQVSALAVDGMVTPGTPVGVGLAVAGAGMVVTHVAHGWVHDRMGHHIVEETADKSETAFDY